MKIRCVWEHNGDDTLLYAVDFVGAYTRGESLEKAIAKIKESGIELLENESLSKRSSFKIGGEARAYALPESVEQLKTLCTILNEYSVSPMVLGNGSNILFPDEGLRNLIIIGTEKLCAMELMEDGAIYAEAGISLAKLAIFAQQNALTGLEFAGGIPGSLGGGTLMNAGAYGGELKDVVESVSAYSLKEQRMVELSNAECRFDYRTSLFQQEGGYVLLGAKFRLSARCTAKNGPSSTRISDEK